MKKWILPVAIVAAIIIASIFVYRSTHYEGTPATKTDMLRAMYNKCSKLELPFEYSADNNYVTQTAMNSDTLFLPAEVQIVGALQDTTRYFAFIYYVGERTVLNTFDKKGNKISEQFIDNPCWEEADECSSYKCDATTTISEIDSIFIVKEQSYGNCDDEGDPIGVQIHHESSIQKGIITSKGKIRMQKAIVKTWEESALDTMQATPPQAIAPGDSAY